LPRNQNQQIKKPLKVSIHVASWVVIVLEVSPLRHILSRESDHMPPSNEADRAALPPGLGLLLLGQLSYPVVDGGLLMPQPLAHIGEVAGRQTIQLIDRREYLVTQGSLLVAQRPLRQQASTLLLREREEVQPVREPACQRGVK